MTPFNAEDFPREYIPLRVQPDYEFTILKNGPFNITARGTYTAYIQYDNRQSTFSNTKSLIFKWAKTERNTLEPRTRQAIEELMLRRFSWQEWKYICRESGVRVPWPYWRNVDRDILVMEDLGPVVALWDILSPGAAEWALFFYQLHDPGIELGPTRSDGTHHLERLVRERDRNLAIDYLFGIKVKPILEPLTQLVGNAQELYERVLNEFFLPAPLPCVSHGDCHPGNILLPDWSVLAEDSPDDPLIGIVDWELSQAAGRGVDGDIAQLLAALVCQREYLETLYESVGQDSEQASKATGLQKAISCCDSFINGIVTRYAFLSSDAYGPLLKAKLVRTTAIILGREIINVAYGTEWDLEGYAVTLDELRIRLVKIAADYLRNAGKTDEDASWRFSNAPPCIISTLFCLQLS
ncbi:hypothetical protein NPX13_g10951 [Xylaria arbuscula]|uniref:Aminoglycoside phosphotransferase domain-containing protein n=1 Tax=Xylaria arbuscula TaxID=114810 RepID=A0A9W8N434_9PEZI|nr:hypothetical protein NPX13_g10951 [Xylaria arbuscula]